MPDGHETNAAPAGGQASDGVYELFKAQAEATPSAIAAVWAGGRYTYAQLEQAINLLARRLGQAGVVPGSRVALYLPRSPDLLVACLAIWKAGATYVPLDLSSPPFRVQMMQDQCQPALLVYASSLLAVPDLALPPQYLDISLPAIAPETAPPAGCDRPRGAAYILFTSGSTGRPKGVVVDHASLSGLLRGVRDRLGLSARDTVAATSNLTFDIAALELFLPLICGASVHLFPEGLTRDALALRDALEASEATVVQGTPSMWRALLETDWRGGPLTAIAGGEVLDPNLARCLKERVARLWNGYGPTEATIYATLHEVETRDLESKAIPIGAALAGVTVYVVDEQGAPAKDECPGEILIGGGGLARGYLDRPDLDRQRFGAFGLGERLYRTGDLAYWRDDGQLMFVGRIDAQIKFRGLRIEPGDIETRLLSIAGVTHAAVVLRRNHRGRTVLAGYLVASRRLAPPTDAAIRANLARWLPNAMIPSVWVWLEAPLLNANGKLDRATLPELPAAPLEPSLGARSASTIEAIAHAWGEALGRGPLGADEDFFGAGGDSLLALNAVFMTSAIIGRELNVAALIEHPTPARFATLRIAGLASDSGQGGALVRASSEPVKVWPQGPDQ